MDGVIVGGWGWVIAAYGSAGACLGFYFASLLVRQRIGRRRPVQKPLPEDTLPEEKGS